MEKKAVLLVVTLSSFLTPFMLSSVNIALPAIGKEFSMDAVVLNWVATAFLLSASVFLLPFGKIADIYGRKKIFLYGSIIYTIFSILCAFSVSSTQLILFRTFQGVGITMTFASGMAILTSVFPVGERGKALGINVTAVYIGLSLGPFVGGFLTQQFGWRSIFLMNGPLGILIIVFILWKLKGEWAESKGEKLDFLGSVIYGVMIIAIMYGLSSLPMVKGIIFILIGIIAFFLLVNVESRAKHPMLDIKLFKNNMLFTFSNLSAFINYSATFAVGFLLSLYLQYIKGISPKNAGLILITQPVVMAIFSPFAGRLSDKIEPRKIASVGMSVTVIGLFFLTFLNEKTAIEMIVGCLVILGFGFALFSSPNANSIMSSVGKNCYGIASATLGTMRLTGQTFSMGIVMLVFAIYLGKIQITSVNPALFIASIKLAFFVFAGLCFLGVFASLARGNLR